MISKLTSSVPYLQHWMSDVVTCNGQLCCVELIDLVSTWCRRLLCLCTSHKIYWFIKCLLRKLICLCRLWSNLCCQGFFHADITQVILITHRTLSANSSNDKATPIAINTSVQVTSIRDKFTTK